MKKILVTFFLFIILLSPGINKTFAQDDCCGLGSILSSIFYSGIHGGYGFQQFNAEGLNHYIDVYNQKRTATLTKKMDDFGFATGFKFGANLFQFLVDDWIIGMKVSYHILKEEHEATANLPAGGTARREYELTYKSFHTGLIFSYYLSKHLDLKVLDASITFNSADLKNRFIEPGTPTQEQKLTSVENPIGFNIASGFTFYIIPPYISIEGTIGYSIFSIDEMEFDNNALLQVDEDTPETMENFIDGGGLYGFAQLNIAIPFN